MSGSPLDDLPTIAERYPRATGQLLEAQNKTAEMLRDVVMLVLDARAGPIRTDYKGRHVFEMTGAGGFTHSVTIEVEDPR